MISAEQIAKKLKKNFEEAIKNGDYAELPYRNDLAQALLMIIDERERTLQQLLAKVFMFGYHLATHKDLENIEQEISEEEQEELIKRCINCNSLTASGGTLKCKLEKCKYEK